MTFNVLGYPAMALPIGFTRDGLPLSLQLAARPQHEQRVLDLGLRYQSVTHWHRRRPTNESAEEATHEGQEVTHERQVQRNLSTTREQLDATHG
jgi:hypothetical protein